MQRYDYKNMLGLIHCDLKNYKHRLNQCQTVKISEDDTAVIQQLCKVIEEIKSLEKFVKCTLREL
ncbi:MULTISPECIES: hypothetical protein [Clostridium]|uniref:Uncharacterized protein n=1 Tax=Clostridium sporogenes TaxID=1509 RepID=A0A1L3NK46_CLOSG|nr:MULTISPECIES: hypothetical protein [Clostridium]APH16509.1 hypothetical protein NPD5_3919 [Clostridium sporogenes]MBD5639470.1 hypothetical protein [Clostridium botulinum]MDI6918984.1 hypothetical protein [Clostridium botulinum]WMU99798.1 hypothetical protein QA656_19385 [Clostridium botulinum]